MTDKNNTDNVETTVDSVDEKVQKNDIKSERNTFSVDKKGNKKTVLALIALVLVISIAPLFMLKGAEFGGSDDAGSEVVAEIKGKEYEPWFEPVMEKMIGGELPGEVESLLFCVQTGIGVGIVAYTFGYLVARKKYSSK